MGEFILIIVLSVVFIGGAVAGFGVVKFFMKRIAAFVASAAAFVFAVGCGVISVAVVAFSGLAIVIESLSKDNAGAFYLMLGGVLVFFGGVFLLGASVGGFVAALLKKDAANPQSQ